MSLLISDAAIATVDAEGTEYPRGYIVVEGEWIRAIGAGSYPPESAAPASSRAGPLAGSDGFEPVTDVLDARGCLATPGLVNTHHHLYQFASRALAQQQNLFGWLTELYPVWSGIDEDLMYATAGAGLAILARSGCTTSTDHHYVFPKDGGDLFAALIAAASQIGLRFHACRGSMDLGESHGGLPPDSLVESTDAALSATAAAIERFHDPRPQAMVQVAVAPCSPFSVTSQLMREAAALARDRGVRLHTHLAETLDEERFCREQFNCTPVQLADELGWLGDDVWLAHMVHLEPTAIARLGATSTGIAHCPSSNARLGAGIAPVRALLDAGVPVGLAVDGAASQEAGELGPELRQALYLARLRDGATALTARDALALGTINGARCLGRQAEIGSLEVGKLADIALWRIDGLAHAGIADPVAALVFGAPPPVQALLVGGERVVDNGQLRTAEESELALALERVSRKLVQR